MIINRMYHNTATQGLKENSECRKYNGNNINAKKLKKLHA